ncbi:MAG: DUF4258 domain-containing protein [Candidatus Brocadiales bacterium]|nr:DUF4258 domain-containing protein [Candidatus Brocadiales bacterium]
MEVEKIQAKIRNGEYRFSDHAVKKMIERAINRTDVEDALLAGEIDILVINTRQAVLSMARRKKVDIYMFRFHCPQG